MLRVAIVEDMACERQNLRVFLQRYQVEKNVSFEILEFSDGAELLSNYPTRLDLLLMDIQMEHTDGIKTAHRVREYDTTVILIFITNMIQYAIEGYQVDALNFMIKPIEYSVFSSEITRALSRIAQRGIVLTVKNSEGLFTVDSVEIGYIEAFNHRTILHTKDRVIPTRQTMVSMQKRLCGLPFFRNHAAFLINMDRIERVCGNDVWIFGQQLPISKYRRKEFMTAYTAHLGEIL